MTLEEFAIVALLAGGWTVMFVIKRWARRKGAEFVEKRWGNKNDTN